MSDVHYMREWSFVFQLDLYPNETQEHSHTRQTYLRAKRSASCSRFPADGFQAASSVARRYCCVAEPSLLEHSPLGSTTHILSHAPLKLHLWHSFRPHI